mmetsp:Transcript_23635/g.66339  ORF Transcript_23635/g.66339 Transcript_23635/m.66339 type:complete len:224 (-) Transcript_23635:1257-1928(-)
MEPLENLNTPVFSFEWNSSMASSTVPFMMNFLRSTRRVWPRRWMRPAACTSSPGSTQGPRRYTTSAAVSVMPTLPARIVITKTLLPWSDAWNLRMAVCRDDAPVLPLNSKIVQLGYRARSCATTSVCTSRNSVKMTARQPPLAPRDRRSAKSASRFTRDCWHACRCRVRAIDRPKGCVGGFRRRYALWAKAARYICCSAVVWSSRTVDTTSSGKDRAAAPPMR